MVCGDKGLGRALYDNVVSCVVDLISLFGTWMILNMWYVVSWFGRPKSLLLMLERYVILTS